MATEARVRDIAWELYGEPVERFTQGRNDRAKEAGKDGDRELAAQVKQLRKPSVGAWLVNMLVRRFGEEVDQVLTLGAQLRAAQANLEGEELRALDKQRRQLTTAVTSQARSLARELGHKATDQAAAQVEDTLRAAMADETAAAAVRSGMLIATLSPSGFGQVDVQGAIAVPEALTAGKADAKRPGVSKSKTEGPSAKQRREQVKATEALSAAQEQLDQAQERHRQTQEATQQAHEARAASEDELRSLREQVRQAERQVTQAKRTEQAAAKEQERAEREEDSAQRAVQRARSRLERLG